MPMRTRGSDGAGPSQGGDDIPNPPPTPPSLADAIAVLLSATTDIARLLRELAQRQPHPAPNFRAQHNGEGETRYMDFTKTRPPVFTKADEPLEANDWLRTMEHKFSLIRYSETQKPLFAAQQLRGATGAWWENFLAIQYLGHPVTWVELKDAFRSHYIPEGLMAIKAEEFARPPLFKDVFRSSGSSHRIKQSRNGVRQSNGRPGRWGICSTSIASTVVNKASTASVGSGVGVSALTPVPRSTDGSCRSFENVSSGIAPRVDAILASSSAASLYRRAT